MSFECPSHQVNLCILICPIWALIGYSVNLVRYLVVPPGSYPHSVSVLPSSFHKVLDKKKTSMANEFLWIRKSPLLDLVFHRH